jgi:leucine dehydrogenase
VLWAPDFVANAGGIINISVEFAPTGYDPALARRRVRGIGDTLRTIYDTAGDGMTPLAAAMELARTNLSDSRA